MKVGAVVNIFWNMMAIQVTLGPRKYQYSKGILPPNKPAIKSMRPLGSFRNCTTVHSVPKAAKAFVMAKFRKPFGK